jgi:histidine ammonia-lyase
MESDAQILGGGDFVAEVMGLSMAEIARHVGVCASAVAKRLEDLRPKMKSDFFVNLP